MNKVLNLSRSRVIGGQEKLLNKCIALINASCRHYYVDEAPTIGKTPDKESPDFKVVCLH